MATTILGDSRNPEDYACTPEERRFLDLYHAADDAGKRRITRMAAAAVRGLLPPAGQLNTPEEIDRFLDSLPELQS